MSEQTETIAANNKGFFYSIFGKDRAVHLPGELGIWILIIGDLTLYCVLFLTFMGSRADHLRLCIRSTYALHPTIGGMNMLILLFSSLAVALGVRAMREKIAENKAPMLFAIAIACAFWFVLNKIYEYTDMALRGATPVANVFFAWYYVLTGLHLLHLLGGTVCLFYMFNVAKRVQKGPNDIRNCENAATFWHAVDLLWVVLFPLLYLMR